MDVQCERCKAEYDFDDALISGRGTTVKCTNCGHQFKIRKAQAADGTPDRWAVKTTEGRDLVFTSLRELQKAIHALQVGRADTLTRGQTPPRALGTIAELEPFFDEAAVAANEKGPNHGSQATANPAARARASQPTHAPHASHTNQPSTTNHSSQSGSAPRPLPDGKQTMLMASSAVAQVPKKSSRPPPPLGGRPIPTLRPIGSPTPPPTAQLPPMRPRIDTIRPPATANAAVPPPLPSTKPRPLNELTDDSGAKGFPGPPVSIAPVLSAGDLVPESRDLIPESQDPEALAEAQAEKALPIPGPSSDQAIPLRNPTAAHPAPAPPPRTLLQAPASAVSHPPPAPRMGPSVPPDRSNRPPPPTITVETPQALPPPTVPVRVQQPPRRALSSLDEEEVEVPGTRPRRLGGWLVALVLLAGAGVIGFAVAKPYLDAQGTKKDTSGPLDPHAAQLLAEGERALSGGDLEGANEAFTKASALADKDPHVLLDVARLADARADVPWLRLRLLPSGGGADTDDERATKAQLTDLGARAKKAADDANTAAPDQPSAILSRIDAYRITGEEAAARALVSKVIQSASQPDTAYALAALDLAEPEPLWPMVIERLHLAAAGEGDAGRARAALVYALARSGDANGAKAELDKLAGLARPYPLVGPLRAFVSKVPDASKDAGAGHAPSTGAAVAAGAAVDVNALPHAAAHGSGGGGGGGAGGGGGGGGETVRYSGANDPRFLLAQAESAKGSHDLERARALYSSALAQNANDSEALAGLGDVDHASHDLPGAAGYYKRALGVNPVYLPALVGLGDVEWESGDKDEAQRTYRDIMDRFPEGTYPGRVRQRANGDANPAATATAPATSPAADPTGSP